MTDEEVLNKAIELLRRGWVKGQAHVRKRGRWPWQRRDFYCATGAVDTAVAGGEYRDYRQSERIVDLLNDKTWEVTELCHSIALYNDRHAWDVEAVIKIFEKVRADLPSEGH